MRRQFQFISVFPAAVIFLILSGTGQGQDVTKPRILSTEELASLPDHDAAQSLVKILEMDLSEGRVEKAREHFGALLDRPHVNSDVLLQVGIQFAERELYAEAA